MENLFYTVAQSRNCEILEIILKPVPLRRWRICFEGTKIVNLDLSFFDTSNVTDMSYMFEGMSGLTGINWGTKFITTKVINMEGMFSNVVKLTALDLSLFNTALVTNMARHVFGNDPFEWDYFW